MYAIIANKKKYGLLIFILATNIYWENLRHKFDQPIEHS